MPIPTREQDAHSLAVEAGATALANADGSTCFDPRLPDTPDRCIVRETYRVAARTVLAGANPQTAVEQVELARDALRRSGVGIDQVTGPIAPLIDKLNTEAREAVRSVGADAKRYRIEARQVAEDSGRRMRLIVQLFDALCEAPRTSKVRAALDAVDVEARRSPWIAEQIADMNPEGHRG